jgi:hypothetical protein
MSDGRLDGACREGGLRVEGRGVLVAHGEGLDFEADDPRALKAAHIAAPHAAPPVTPSQAQSIVPQPGRTAHAAAHAALSAASQAAAHGTRLSQQLASACARERRHAEGAPRLHMILEDETVVVVQVRDAW